MTFSQKGTFFSLQENHHSENSIKHTNKIFFTYYFPRCIKQVNSKGKWKKKYTKKFPYFSCNEKLCFLFFLFLFFFYQKKENFPLILIFIFIPFLSYFSPHHLHSKFLLFFLFSINFHSKMWIFIFHFFFFYFVQKNSNNFWLSFFQLFFGMEKLFFSFFCFFFFMQ